jgi:FkbM family methyltransferase
LTGQKLKKAIVKILKLLRIYSQAKAVYNWVLAKYKSLLSNKTMVFNLVSTLRKSLNSYRARALFWEINSKIRKTITVRTKQGMFKVSTSDKEIGKHLFCSREYDVEFMLKVLDFLNRQKTHPENKGTIIDIGANVGFISIGLLCNHLFERAIAIEPDPKNFSLLQDNVQINNLANSFICLPYAVSDKKDTVQFELSKTNFGDHRIRTNSLTNLPELYTESDRRVIEVETDCLDHLIETLPNSFINDIAVIWIDIQGYEGYAFRGGRHLLSKNIPVVAEIWPYGIQRAGMSQEQYCKIAAEFWSNYWVIRNGEFISYPISQLNSLFDELGYNGNFYNIILTK